MLWHIQQYGTFFAFYSKTVMRKSDSNLTNPLEELRDENYDRENESDSG